MGVPSLKEWDDFYVILGSSAAGLTGLTFVVIALAADARRISPAGLAAYVAPTIVHFGCVLAVAVFLCVPHQTTKWLSYGFVAGGSAGIIYVGTIAVGMRRIARQYQPVLEDWLWHVTGPALLYAAVLVLGLLMRESPEDSLYGIAAVATALLFIGIHNAWDVAISISTQKQTEGAVDPHAGKAP